MSVLYATLDDVLNEVVTPNSNADDDYIIRVLRLISRRIDNIINPTYHRPYFAPYLESRSFQIAARNINSSLNTFDLKTPILSWSAVSVDGTDVTSNIRAYPLTREPVTQLELNTTGTTWYNCGSSSKEPRYVTITGEWGYSGNFDNALLEYDELKANLSIGGSTMTVNNIDGADPYGQTPRFSVGSICKINDEYTEVIGDIDAAANTCTMRRGILGTTEADHVTTDTVYVWQVDDPIKRAIIRQTGSMYARRGSYQAQDITDFGSIIYPQDLLAEMRQILMEYNYNV